jgi:hypothetical protein
MSKLTDLIGLGVPAIVATNLDADTVSSEPTRTVSTGLTATGTVIGDALALVSLVNVLSTVAASTGAKLPDASVGSTVFVQNNGANALNLFPHSSSGTINGGSAGAAVTIAAAAGNICTRLSSTDWLVSVYAKET